jgi:hypothetical protein
MGGRAEVVVGENGTQGSVLTQMVEQRIGIEALDSGLRPVPVLTGGRCTEAIAIVLAIRGNAQFGLALAAKLRFGVEMIESADRIDRIDPVAHFIRAERAVFIVETVAGAVR